MGSRSLWTGLQPIRYTQLRGGTYPLAARNLRGVGQYARAFQHYDKEVRTMNASRRDHVAFLLGRVMLGGIYLYSGITNVIELQGKAGYAASKGLPAPA